MTIEKGIDGAWYAVWPEANAAWDHLDEFPGCKVACFGQYDNAIQLTEACEK